MYYVIERHVNGKYQDCFEADAVGDSVFGLHRAPVGAPSPAPKWGNLFKSEDEARKIAAELNSSFGLGAWAEPGRYSVAEFRPNSLASNAI